MKANNNLNNLLIELLSMKCLIFLMILVLISISSIVAASNIYDTKEGFNIEIPSGWMVESDSVNNGIVTFVMENADPYSVWIKISCAPSSRSGVGGSNQEIMNHLKQGLQSLNPTYIDAQLCH